MVLRPRVVGKYVDERLSVRLLNTVYYIVGNSHLKLVVGSDSCECAFGARVRVGVG